MFLVDQILNGTVGSISWLMTKLHKGSLRSPAWKGHKEPHHNIITFRIHFFRCEVIPNMWYADLLAKKTSNLLSPSIFILTNWILHIQTHYLGNKRGPPVFLSPTWGTSFGCSAYLAWNGKVLWENDYWDYIRGKWELILGWNCYYQPNGGLEELEATIMTGILLNTLKILSNLAKWEVTFTLLYDSPN